MTTLLSIFLPALLVMLLGGITKNEVDWRRYLGFQTVEIPMLIELYYVLGYHVDIYPGDGFPFFAELENGLWEKQLPLATQYAKHRSLTFITCM